MHNMEKMLEQRKVPYSSLVTDKPRGASPRRDYVRSEEDGIVQIE